MGLLELEDPHLVFLITAWGPFFLFLLFLFLFFHLI